MRNVAAGRTLPQTWITRCKAADRGYGSDARLVGLGNETTAVLQGYNRADVNMAGWMKYSGAGNDRDFILATVGGVTTAIRTAQLPSP